MCDSNLKLENAKLRAQLTTCQTFRNAGKEQYLRLRKAGEGLAEAIEDLIGLANELPALQPKSWEIQILEQAHTVLSAWHKETNPNGEKDA